MSDKVMIIAEAGINHGGSISKAKQLVLKAKESGADAVKFQIYNTDKRVQADNPAYKILKQCELSYLEHMEVKKFADQEGIEYFSTPFDSDSLKYLVEYMEVRRVKISSFDITNTNFLKEINAYAEKYYNFNVIISVGMSNMFEIGEALKCLDKVGYLTLLQCKSSYPMDEQNANLSAIRKLQLNYHKGSRKFGFSDHSPNGNIDMSALAVIAGATTIERHFTLNYNDGSVDNPVSLDPRDFRKMVDLIRRYEIILGNKEIELNDCERNSLIFRRYS